jgi:wobble nucleotide-excising tRNase
LARQCSTEGLASSAVDIIKSTLDPKRLQQEENAADLNKLDLFNTELDSMEDMQSYYRDLINYHDQGLVNILKTLYFSIQVSSKVFHFHISIMARNEKFLVP